MPIPQKWETYKLLQTWQDPLCTPSIIHWKKSWAYPDPKSHLRSSISAPPLQMQTCHECLPGSHPLCWIILPLPSALRRLACDRRRCTSIRWPQWWFVVYAKEGVVIAIAAWLDIADAVGAVSVATFEYDGPDTAHRWAVVCVVCARTGEGGDDRWKLTDSEVRTKAVKESFEIVFCNEMKFLEYVESVRYDDSDSGTRWWIYIVYLGRVRDCVTWRQVVLESLYPWIIPDVWTSH